MTDNSQHHISSDLVASAGWHKSSYSGPGNACVEIAQLAHTTHNKIGIRDSKHPTGPVVLVTPEGWASFAATLRHG